MIYNLNFEVEKGNLFFPPMSSALSLDGATFPLLSL